MVWRITPRWSVADPNAAAYIAAVEVADGQPLEEPVKRAIDNFVLGCKADGTWNAIKASCILAGARTLAGALVPLVGVAPPTPYAFASGDYNRKTGLVGNGSTKYLDSNRNNQVDPQNSRHLAVFGSSFPSANCLIGAGTLNTDGDSYIYADPPWGFTTRLNTSSGNSFMLIPLFSSNKMVGLNRSSSSGYSAYFNGIYYPNSHASVTPASGNVWVFRAGSQFTASRLAFYSIGESLNLALLDARVTQLVNALAAAIL